MARTPRVRGAAALAIAAACAAPASAELVSDVPITVPADNTKVWAEFLGETADFAGNLYFLGSGDADNVLMPAPDSDPTGLGQFLFNNHAASPGDMVMLIGVFDAGEVLHFAYDIVHPADVEEELFRTDVEDDKKYFDFNATTGVVGIEDMRKPNSDLDYDDIQFRLVFEQVPTPGALPMLAAFALTRRRRRR